MQKNKRKQLEESVRSALLHSVTMVQCCAGSLALDQGMGGEGSVTHPRQAEIYDQLSLFQFLQGKLPEAEVNARRSLAVIQNHFEMEDPAVGMCELRLGTILFSKLLFAWGSPFPPSAPPPPPPLPPFSRPFWPPLLP